MSAQKIAAEATEKVLAALGRGLIDTDQETLVTRPRAIIEKAIRRHLKRERRKTC